MISKLKFYAKLLLKKAYRKEIFDMVNAGVTRKSISENHGNTKVMILRRGNQAVGVFSDYIVFLGQIEEAISTGYIPVVDRQTIKNNFFPADDSVNTWEVFFEQPLGIGLDNITDEMDVYINNLKPSVSPISIMHCADRDIQDYWRKIARKYIRLNDAMKEMVKTNYAAFMKNRRVLGIAIREGYTKLGEQDRGKVANHPIQAATAEMLELAKRYSKEWNCPYVYVTCQTADTVELFQKEFGMKALFYTKARPAYKDLLEGVALKDVDKKDAKQHEMNYVAEMVLLAQCTSMICSENSGAEGAFIMSEGFEHFLCIDKGRY